MKNKKDDEFLINLIKFTEKFRYGLHSQKHRLEVLPLLDFEKEILNCFLNHKKIIIHKCRQMHLDSLISAYVAWNILYNKDYEIVYVAPSTESCKRFINKVRLIFTSYYKSGNLSNYTVKNNSREIELINGSSVITTSIPTRFCGRKTDIREVIYSEAAFIKNIEDINTTFGSNSLAQRKPVEKFILYSTNNGPGDYFQKTWIDANQKNTYKAIELHWSINPYYNKDIKTDKDGSKTNEWYEKKCELYRWQQDVIDRELDLKFTPKKEKPKKEIVNFRIPDVLKNKVLEKLAKKSVETGEVYNFSTYIRELIEADLKN